MTEAEFRAKLKELQALPTETEWVEFKLNDRGQPMYQDIGEYLSAIANSLTLLHRDRGYIAWGIENTSHDLVGTDFRPRKAKVGNEELENWLTHKLDPQIRFIIREADLGRKHFVLFEISPATHTPVAFAGDRYIRVGSIKKKLKDCPEKERELWQKLRESSQDFSAEICPNASMGDLVQGSIESFRKRWLEKTRRAGNAVAADRFKGMGHEQLLSDADLLDSGKLTYAALILFGNRKALNKYLPQAEVIYEYRSAEAPGPAQSREEFREGFFGFFERLWQAVNARNDTQSFHDGPFVMNIQTFSERVVREAVLNAISHRDYQLAGSIFIRQFPRRLEVDSPGGFPIGITPENVIDRQNPRNRRIAEAFTKCGLVERSGQGMNLIFEESIRQSKPRPDFARTDQYQVGMTLYGTMQDPHFIRFLEKVGQEKTATFNTRDWLILDFISRGDKLPREYQNRIDRLVELGVVEKTGARKYIFARRYYTFAGRPEAYTRRKGLDYGQNMALLLNHITDHASTGTQFQTLCAVLPAIPEDGVKGLLRRLRRTGKVHCEGRTRAALWYPGPAARRPATGRKKR